MPVSPRETVLCRYSHDPLDRQTDCMLLTLPAIQRFYCRSRLATEIQGALRTNVFQHDDQLLAQQRQQDGKVDTTLLATDQKRTVLGAHGLTGSHFLAYTPYGHRPPENGLLSLLGFNGERPDPVTGHYHLGNGYRQFNPVLMRFNSPDSWSPFGEGGMNAYAYCGGEPVNRADPTGHMFKLTVFFGLIDDMSALGTTRAAAANTRKAMMPISEVSELSTKATSQSAQSLAVKTMRTATDSDVTRRSATVVLPKFDNASFRNALEHAIEGGQSVRSIDSAPISTPLPTPTQKPRPVRTRNTVVLGGDKDFVQLKVAEARSSNISNQTTQIRKS